MKKTIGYLRVSTEEQSKNYGLDVQKDKIETFCKLHDIENVEFYADSITGKTLEREGLKKLLEEVRNGNVSNVIVFKADRLTRKLRDLLGIIEDEFEPNDVAFISVAEQFDTSTPTGKAFLSMLGTFAELERNTIVYRTTSGRVARAKKGGKVACGSTPYGYKNVDGELKQESQEISIVKTIFAMRADGLTYRDIAKILNDDGVETKRGGKWYASTVRYIAENRKYQGYDIYNFNVKEFGINETIEHMNANLAVV
jgi:site-specific DNA recombinase